MAKKRPARSRAALNYPSHWFTPEELLSFIELPYFTRRWVQLGLSDLDLELLQVIIMLRPKGGDVVEGTGGLRTLRYSPATSDKGKSGGLRVCYAYIEEVATVILALIYAKGEKDDLTAAEKTTLRKALQRIEKSLLSKPYRRSRKTT